MAGKALILVENLSVPFDRRVWQESTALRDAGWDVHVICPQGVNRDTESEVVIDGVHIHRYPLRAATGPPLGYLREYATALWHTSRLAHRVGRVDVVHACNPPDLLFLIAWRLRRRGARFVFDQHDLVPELYRSRFGHGKDLLYRVVCGLEWASYRAADVVIATNESYREVACSRGGKRPDQVFVVRSAPAMERFRPVPPDPRIKRGKPYLLCYLGVMGPQDGVDYALRALAALRDELGRTDWRAVFIGSGDVFDDMVALAGRLGLSDCVEFTGRIPDADLLRYLSTADVCLAPDPHNPLNDVSTMNKIMEYMAMARPIVSFDLREARVSAGDAALFAPANDEQAFARLVARLLDDPEKRRRMGAIGHARVTGPLSWEHSRAMLLTAYETARPVQKRPVQKNESPHMTRLLARIISQPYARLRRLVGEELFERRFGVQTAGRVLLDDLGLSTQDRVYYVPASWLTLRRALPRREVTEHDVFIDFGSGMGRMVLEAATYPFKRVIGVELAGRLHDIACDNIDRNRRRLRCKDIVLIQSDVLEYEIPDDVTVVFFNNPFRNQIFATVIQRLLDSVERKPRAIRVIYGNPVEDALLMSTGRCVPLKTIPRPKSGQDWSPWGTVRTYVIT